jgi:hypothetical protein
LLNPEPSRFGIGKPVAEKSDMPLYSGRHERGDSGSWAAASMDSLQLASVVSADYNWNNNRSFKPIAF